MAEQARKFGGRIAELRNEKGWTGRQLVERMAELGDRSINTNQLSRYENGGAMPGEQRQERFADALETDVADLVSGPLAERGGPRREPGDFGDRPTSPASAEDVAQLRRELQAVADQLAEIGGALAEAGGVQEQLRPLLPRLSDFLEAQGN